MRYCCLFFFLAFFLFSCGNKDTVPADVLSINELKSIVWDLELAGQSASEKFPVSRDSLRMESTSLFGEVFAKHKMDKKVFYHSFAFYESHPNWMKILLDSVDSYGGREKQKSYQHAF